MEFKNVIENRRSIRKFTEDKIDPSVVNEIIRLASLAPSVNNAQPWKFLVISNKSKLEELGNIVKAKIDLLLAKTKGSKEDNAKHAVEKFSTFFVEAPVFVAVCIKPYSAIVDTILEENNLTPEAMDKMRNYPNIQSLGACIENLLLSAFNEGLSGCWLTGLLIAKEELEAALNISTPYSLGACVALGKSDEGNKIKERADNNSLIEWID